MPDTASISLGGAVLEVVSPDGARRYVRVTQTPFLIGRGAETGNHLQLSDRRISRNCAALVLEAGRLYIEDRGQRRGLFVNGEKVESRQLNDGDSITFGLEDSYEIVFRSGTAAARSLCRICLRASSTSRVRSRWAAGCASSTCCSKQRLCCTHNFRWIPCSARCSITPFR